MLKCTNSGSYFCPLILPSVWPKYLCQYENMCQISVHHHTRDKYISQSEAPELGMEPMRGSQACISLRVQDALGSSDPALPP